MKGRHSAFLAISHREQVIQRYVFDYACIRDYDLWHLVVSVT